MSTFRKSIVLAICVGLTASGCGYNSLPTEEENVSMAWANADAAFRRRADLIPNLVNTVKGYAKHEASVLEEIAEKRSRVGSISLSPNDLGDSAAMGRFQAAQAQLSGSFSRLLAVSENYPNLKADKHFGDLMAQLEGTENRITIALQDYNQAVAVYNSHLRRFPASLTNALLLHLQPKRYFQATEQERARPDVQF